MIELSKDEIILVVDDIECCYDEWGDLSSEKCKLLKRISDAYPEIQKTKHWLYEEVERRVH